MVDRIFAGVMLAIVIAYAVVAFTVIKAPFQYDPLGPESWPRIISVVAGLCCLVLLLKPAGATFAVAGRTLGRLALVLALLAAYAGLFQPLGFILSTAAFCAATAMILGATPIRAIAFGTATGVVGYGVGAELLALNLPHGLL